MAILCNFCGGSDTKTRVLGGLYRYNYPKFLDKLPVVTKSARCCQGYRKECAAFFKRPPQSNVFLRPVIAVSIKYYKPHLQADGPAFTLAATQTHPKALSTLHIDYNIYISNISINDSYIYIYTEYIYKYNIYISINCSFIDILISCSSHCE